MKILPLILISVTFSSCQKQKGESPAVQESVPSSQQSILPPDTLATSHDTITSIIIGLEIGNKAPDINLKDSGNVFHSLSSLKNKLVLIDFWASWCAPCRSENKNLKTIYPKYKGAAFKEAVGFEIYSVSTDTRRIGWINCMTNDNYNWPHNVLDEHQVASSLYHINSLPTNFLMDANGIIIAKNLRDSMVEKTLIRLLK